MSELAYPLEGQSEELIGSEIVMLAPASRDHVFISGNVYSVFANYLRGKQCIPIADNMTVYLTDEDRFVPDMMVVCDESKIETDGVHGAPDLVVEVLSSSTAKNDRGRKKDVYGRSGVREYWLISPGDRTVEVYRNDGNGALVLGEIYTLPREWELQRMSKKARADIKTHFKCSLFDDLDIALEDVFYRT